MGHTIRTIAGIGLLIMAVIGSLLPVLQGWVFFVAALGVLGSDHVITKWIMRHMEPAKVWWRKFRGKKAEEEPKP